jgi:hypothetical protein
MLVQMTFFPATAEILVIAALVLVVLVVIAKMKIRKPITLLPSFCEERGTGVSLANRPACLDHPDHCAKRSARGRLLWSDERNLLRPAATSAPKTTH